MKQNNAPTYGSNVRNDKDVVESATVAAVERTMKKYADNLLRVLEGMSGRLSQLESNNQRMENFVSGIKGEAANNHGSTDGKLRALENMIREVLALSNSPDLHYVHLSFWISIYFNTAHSCWSGLMIPSYIISSLYGVCVCVM